MTFIDRLLARLATSPPLFLQHWGYPFLFGLVFLEGIPFLGLVIPGHTATILAGFLAKLGVLDLWAVLLFVFLGMLLGDIVAYELGRRWGHAFIVRYGTRFHFREKEYRRVRSLLRNHPGKTIIIGKFQMLTRLFGPFVAGATEVNRGLFNLLNTIAALLWTICFVLIGYLFGQGFQAAERVIGTFALLALIFLLLLALPPYPLSCLSFFFLSLTSSAMCQAMASPSRSGSGARKICCALAAAFLSSATTFFLLSMTR